MKFGIVAAALLLASCTKPYDVKPASQGPSASATVEQVEGDGTGGHLRSAVILHGEGLEGATVTLEQNGVLTPLVTSPHDGGLQALLPVDLQPGSARLHVKAGEAELERDIQLLQGEPGAKGDAGPKGDAGQKGDVGPKGDAGPVGPAGPQGVVGPQGPAGALGATGAMGPMGPMGKEGPTGATGSQGLQGVKGDTGPQGPKGDTGAKGATGDDGILGVDMLSPSGDTLVPEKQFELIGDEQTVSLSDDAYLTIVADVRAVGLDAVQPRDVIVGIRIAGEDYGDRTLRVPAEFKQSGWDAQGRAFTTYYGSEGRMTLLFKTADKVKSGDVKIALAARCGEARSTDCKAIEFRSKDQRIVVTQSR